MPVQRRVRLWLALLSTIYSQADAFTMLGGPHVQARLHAGVQRASTVHLQEAKKSAQTANRFDLLIIGGGPVGVTAALRAAALGRTAILIDNTPPKQFQFTGPTGLFSKALRDSALRIDVAVLRSMNIDDEAIWNQVDGSVQRILRQSGDNNAGALAMERVPSLRGRGTLVVPAEDCNARCSIAVLRPNQAKPNILQADQVLLATGSRALRMAVLEPWYEVDVAGHRRCFDSDSIKGLSFLPQSVVIVGGGIIAVEFARIFSQLKAKVTMVVRSPNLAISLKRVGIDPALAAVLQADLLLEGVEILFESEVAGGGLTAQDPNMGGVGRRGRDRQPLVINCVKSGSKEINRYTARLQTDLVLTATGRRAVTEGIGLEALGVEIAPNGDVAVGPDLMTGAAGVYAAGDLIGAPQLASTGIAQAEAVVETIFGDLDPECLEGEGCSPQAFLSNAARYPVGIWTIPELAFVGLTYEAAKGAPHNLDVIEGVGRYSATIRGHVHTVGTKREGEYLRGDTRGAPAMALTGPALKLVVERAAPHVVVGVHIFGDDACELIHFGTLLVQGRKTVADVLGLCFAAVTYHELFKLAARDALASLQREQWRALFLQMDDAGDSSGLLDRDEVLELLEERGLQEEAKEDIMRRLFKGSDSLSVDKFVTRAQQLRSVRQLELMGDGELTLR